MSFLIILVIKTADIFDKAAHVLRLKALTPQPLTKTRGPLKRRVGYAEEDETVMEARKQVMALKISEKVVDKRD